MLLRCTADEIEYSFESSDPLEISIPLDFFGSQPRAYGAPPAGATPLRMGGFVGDTREGGSCNCETYTLTPHCNGTHTECVGHIAKERISVLSVLKDGFFPGTLISVPVESASPRGDTYRPPFTAGDRYISRASIERAVNSVPFSWLEALVIRTLPNSPAKLVRNYGDSPAAFFSVEAMQYIASLPVRHLIVDLPSVDRAEDEGKLTAHHFFWSIKEGSHMVTADNHSGNTITELVYVPDSIPDGSYFVQIEISPFVADASPSRVKLFTPRRAA